MTKHVKILIALVSILLILSLVATAFEIRKLTNNLSTTMYDARKEDLQKKNYELEKIVIDLNNTLQEEKLKEEKLSEELDLLTNQTTKTTTSSNPAPKPPSQPTTPVTRAS